MKIRFAAVAAALLTGVLAPSAMGARVLVERPCYRAGDIARFDGDGFPPGQPVAISVDGQQLDTGPADPLGSVRFNTFPLPTIPGSEQARTLTMAQVANPAIRAAVVFTQTNIYVVTKPESFKPGRRLRIRAGGFFGAGGTLYSHIRGPSKRNLRIGKIKGPCGKVSATKKAILKRGDRPGRYLVQFDTVKRYVGRRAPIGFRREFTIRRIFRFSRSSSFSSPVLGGATSWGPDA